MGEVVKIYQENNVQKRMFKAMGNNGAQNPTGSSNQPMGGYTQPMGGSTQPMGGYTQSMGGYNQPLPSSRGGSGKIILNYLGIAGGIITIMGAIAAVIYGVIVPITQHTDSINGITGSIANLDDDIKELSGDVKELSEFVYTNYGNQGGNLESGKKDEIKRIEFIDENYPKMDEASNEPELQNAKWEKYVSVAKDEDGNEYNSDDLQNVTFITSYIEGGKEVYFLGQYNENDNWNGKCILNVYEGEKLDSVLEAIYNNGELYSYKRVSREADGKWKVTDKINKKDYKIGETWIYNVSETYEKNISLNDYDESKMLVYEDFLYLEKEELLSYYNGKTSDGYYNEDKEDSYLIKYFTKNEIDFGENERVIKTIYKGNFVNGIFEDESDKSWYITREPNTTYMYYEGSFNGGKADHINEKEFENPAGYEYIEKKLNEKGFEKYLDEFLIDY